MKMITIIRKANKLLYRTRGGRLWYCIIYLYSYIIHTTKMYWQLEAYISIPDGSEGTAQLPEFSLEDNSI